METGRRVDKINNKLIPKDYIASLNVTINDKLVFDSHLSRSVSKNPFMHLKVKKLFAGDIIKVSWIDNKNKVYKYKTTINEI
jgi:sulfur-oxidizing protein SoxZ